MGTVLIRLVEHLRMRQRAEGATAPRLRHLSVFEEAHRLLRQPHGLAGGGAEHAVEMFAGLQSEIRAYGEGLIIAEQIPSKLVPNVIKNTAVKIVHRLPAADDREAVGATMNLTEDQSAYLVTLTPGEAAVFTDGMDYPLLTRMPDGTSREIASPAATVSPADHSPQLHLRPSLPYVAVHAAAGARRPARCDRRPADHPVGRAVRGRAPDRLDHAHARIRLRRRPGRGRIPAAGLRLSHAVDAAVTSRIPVISSRVSGPAFAVHVVDAMHAALDEDRPSGRSRKELDDPHAPAHSVDTDLRRA